jgi:hypothetical protein
MRFGGLLIIALVVQEARSEPPRPSPFSDKSTDLQLRLDDWLRTEAALRDAEAGRVDPVWRQAERAIAAEFHPSVDMVTDAHATKALVGQMRGFLRNIETSPQIDGSGRGDGSIADEIRIERLYEEEPGIWERVDIQVVVDGDGKLLSSKLLRKSWRRELDDAVHRAVKDAVRRIRPSRRTTVTFSVSAGVVVQPPTVLKTGGDPRNVGVTAALKFKFDETTGKVQPRLWLLKRVVTRAKVIAISSE